MSYFRKDMHGVPNWLLVHLMVSSINMGKTYDRKYMRNKSALTAHTFLVGVGDSVVISNVIVSKF